MFITFALNELFVPNQQGHPVFILIQVDRQQKVLPNGQRNHLRVERACG